MISVVVCAHNPKSGPMERVLAALLAQTLPRGEWELLVVDNASREPVASRFDIGWHPSGRHVGEPAQGLTRARLRGIAEARGDILVWVDDDNVLAPDYLEYAASIGRSHPFLGAWGGQILCEYETPPPYWVLAYQEMLGREVSGNTWSNLTCHSVTTPYGAGLCVRADVAQKYARRVNEDPLRLKLGRNGADLSSGEDNDLAYTACQMGMGTGLFEGLRLQHLIPASRLTLDYFTRLAAALSYSHGLLYFIWTGQVLTDEVSRTERLFRLYRDLRQPAPMRAIARAKRLGLARAANDLRNASGPK